LFNTGVFNEVTFHNFALTNITASGNALLGTQTIGAATRTVWTFGRTVIVTEAFLRKRSLVGDANTAQLVHHTSQLAAGTVFATLEVTVSMSTQERYTWANMNVTAKTFTSSEVLGFSFPTGTAASGGSYDLIVRYKEK
jgi:hypothetical protein